MIIVFAEDQTVAVLPDLDSVRRECETVDVENGVYRFFDDLGRHLLPRWTAPVERRSLLFRWIGSVGGGSFDLEVDPQDEGSAFQSSLADVVAIVPNPTFETIADLARHVAEHQRR